MESQEVTLPSFSTDAARYEALRQRDSRADGQFFYSVATTGVYCRPSCAARLARRENIDFHPTPDDAERAGYRACKRCRPRDVPQHERHARIVEDARRRLESADETPVLAKLATEMGLSPHYFHRLFKEHVGMTPREYSAAHRLQRASRELRDGASVTSAIYEAGYTSSGRFYEAGGALGMKPSVLRRGAEGIEMHVTVRPCSLGHVLVAATSRGVSAVTFGDSESELRTELRDRFPHATIMDGGDELDALAAKVVDMVESPSSTQAIPLDLVGTAFQQKVWRALREIPPGKTLSYAEIARRIGAPKAVRAVGTACGKNPVAVVVPCHRVVREDGELGGYRWGLARKRQLLERERAK